jgi:hypothetical protein
VSADRIGLDLGLSKARLQFDATRLGCGGFACFLAFIDGHECTRGREANATPAWLEVALGRELAVLLAPPAAHVNGDRCAELVEWHRVAAIGMAELPRAAVARPHAAGEARSLVPPMVLHLAGGRQPDSPSSVVEENSARCRVCRFKPV